MPALVLTDAATAEPNALLAVLDPAQHAGAELATSSGRLTADAAAPLGRGIYDTIVSVATTSGHHGVPLLGALAVALKPGGKLVVKEPGDVAALRKALLLSGFPSSSLPADGSGGLEATKPAWDTGAKAAISLRRPAAAAPAAPTAAKAWALDAGDDDEMIDDEALLTEEDKAIPTPPPARDDCEVGAGGRKACKNCTCGRADEDAPKVKLTPDMLENPQPTGGCGNCSLGDAFRCGGCPYKGLPAFEYGKPIKVSADFLAMDA